MIASVDGSFRSSPQYVVPCLKAFGHLLLYPHLEITWFIYVFFNESNCLSDNDVVVNG